MIANQKPFCNNDPRLDFPATLAEHFKSYQTIASFPLMKEFELLGALTVYSCAAEYDKDQQKLLKEAAAVLANALVSHAPPAPRNIAEHKAKSPANGASPLLEGSSPIYSGTQLQSDLTH